MIREEKKSKDVYFVAALLALGADISNINRTNPKHIEFTVTRNYFDPSQHIVLSENSAHVTVDNEVISYQDLATGYPTRLDDEEILWANGSLMVPAVRFKDALQRLKGIIHSR